MEWGAQRWWAEEGERWRARQAVAAARRASPAHGCHAAVALWRWSGRDARERRGAARRQAVHGAGLRRTRGAREAGAAAGRAGFGRGPRNKAAAREKRKAFFKLCFQEIFKYQFSNIILSKKMTSFENVPKMKVA